MAVLLTNNVASTLASSLTTSSTSLTVATGTGAKFPSPVAPDYFYATIISTTGEIEIVKVTSRANDVMTIVRAQDSTTAKAFPSKSRIEARINAKSVLDAVDDGVAESVATMTIVTNALDARLDTAEANIVALDGRLDVAESEIDALQAFDAALATSSGATSVGFLQAGTGATLRTVRAKLRDIVSVLDFGADPTGVSDSSAAIQAAINTLKPNEGLAPEKGGIVYFPPGTYLVNTTISTYSAIELRGSGAATIMKAGPSLTGAIFQPAATTVTVIYIYGVIEGFRFIASGSVWAIKSTAENVLCSQFRNLTLETTYGISLCRPNTYTQASIVSGVTSFGGIEQILALTGNFNQIERIDKEGATGTSTEPYIYVYGANASGPFGGFADGNSFKKILIEGNGSANKSPIKFLNASGNEIEDFWAELSDTNGYSIDLDNSKVRVRGFWQPGTVAKNKVKLRNGSSLYIDNFNSDTQDVDWQGYFDSDANSICYVEHLVSLRAANTFKIATPGNLVVQQQVVQLWNNTLPAGYSAQFAADYTSGQNLLINPSFEAGIYGWSMSSADTPTFTTSEVGQGLMFECVSTAGFQLTQSVVVSAGQIGKPLTIRYVAKIDGAGWAVPIIAGQAETGIHRVTAGQGWQTVTLTYRPAASGTLIFGLWWLGVGGTSSTIYVDEFSLCAGERGLINPAKFGSLELNQKTLTYATAAPTTGTWKRGDRVFNSTPTVGQPKGWICTVAGTPGTWVSEGNL